MRCMQTTDNRNLSLLGIKSYWYFWLVIVALELENSLNKKQYSWGTDGSAWCLFAPLAKGQLGLCHAGSSVLCVCACVNFFLVRAIETTFLNQSGPNLHEVLMGIRSQMCLINPPSSSRVIGPEILKITFF